MSNWLAKALSIIILMLINLAVKLFKKSVAVFKFNKKAKENIEVATRYEANPTTTDRDALP